MKAIIHSRKSILLLLFLKFTFFLLFNSLSADYYCVEKKEISGTTPSLLSKVAFRPVSMTVVSGNANEHAKKMTDQQSSPPVFDTPPPTTPLTVGCTDDIPPAEVITATGDCGTTTVYVDELRVDGACFGQYTLERRWIAVDECYNMTVSDPQIITVNDQTGPTFNEPLPTNMTLSCENAVPVADTLTAVDCTYDIAKDVDGNFRLDGSVLLNIQTAMNGYNTNNGDSYGVVGTYLVTDYLVNATPQQLAEYNGITFTITTTNLAVSGEPNHVIPNGFGAGVNFQNSRVEFEFSSDVFFSVNGKPSMRAQEFIEFSGDGTILVPYPNNVGSHAQSGLITSVTGPYYLYNPNPYTSSNANLNQIVKTRSIYAGIGTQIVVDHRHPVSAGTNAFFLFELQLFPQQDLVTFTEDTVQGDCPNNYAITRTWTATDECTNTTVHTQEITIQDTVAPVFDPGTLPNDTIINSDAVPPVITASLTATDNCSPATDITFTVNESSTQGAIGTCEASNYMIIRVYRATDVCGNIQEHIQTINVQDTVAPVISNCPTDIFQNNDSDVCGAVVTWTAPTATDNSSSNVTITSSHNSGDVFPVGITTVLYTATDACGNESVCTFEITISDSQNPDVSVTTIPANFCPQEQVIWQEIVSDNCGIASVVRSHNSGDIFPVGTTEVTITATDIHGNDSTYSFSINVLPPPIITLSSDSQELCVEDEVTMSVTNANPSYSYSWYLNGQQVNKGVDYVINSTSHNQSGIYIVEAENEFGCVDSAAFVLNVKPCSIVITETFSPNGDGQNEYFYIENLEAFPNTKVWIHNRWGTQVYLSDDYQNNWNGRSESKLNVSGDELPEGNYFYVLQLGGNENEPTYGKIYKGDVYIKR